MMTRALSEEGEELTCKISPPSVDARVILEEMSNIAANLNVKVTPARSGAPFLSHVHSFNSEI